MTPNEKALKVLDLLLAKFNLTKETCPRGTFIESFTGISYIRYNGEIVACYDETTDMTDDYATRESSRIILEYGTPHPDESEDIMDPREIPACCR